MAAKQKRDIEATRAALLAAARELMTSCSDADEVTSRAIAARAGVNLAMVNYCYGSREALLYEVYRQLLADAQQARPELARLMTADLAPKERIILIHITMMRAMIERFAYSRAVTKYILLNRSEDVGLESLPFIRAHFGDRKTEDECRLIAFELTSLHELAVLRHKELARLCGLDLTEPTALEKYVRDNVERYLGS